MFTLMHAGRILAQPFILEHFESDSQAFSASKQVMYLFIFPAGAGDYVK